MKRTTAARVAKKTAAAARRRVPIAWAGPTAFKVPVPKDESERMADLHGYKILDTPPEENFDNITALAAHICGAPIALVSLVDSDRQWFKSKVGLSVSETSRDTAFCAYAILERDLLMVRDAAADARFAANPLVTASPKIRFYAGAPLVTPDNHAIGTLCVLDRVPRVLTPDQVEALRALSRQVMTQLELRRQIIELRAALRAARGVEKTLRQKARLTEAARSAKG